VERKSVILANLLFKNLVQVTVPVVRLFFYLCVVRVVLHQRAKLLVKHFKIFSVWLQISTENFKHHWYDVFQHYTTVESKGDAWMLEKSLYEVAVTGPEEVHVTLILEVKFAAPD